MFLLFAPSVQLAARLSGHTACMHIFRNATDSLPRRISQPASNYLNLRKMVCIVYGRLVSSSRSPTARRKSHETHLSPSLKPTVQGFLSGKYPHLEVVECRILTFYSCNSNTMTTTDSQKDPEYTSDSDEHIGEQGDENELGSSGGDEEPEDAWEDDSDRGNDSSAYSIFNPS
jgi:hypothetical protein